MSANQISGSGLQFRVGLQQIILSLSSDFMEQFITIGVTCKYKYEHENYHLLVIIHKYYSISIWYQDFTRLLSMAYTISQSCHSQTVFFQFHSLLLMLSLVWHYLAERWTTENTQCAKLVKRHTTHTLRRTQISPPQHTCQQQRERLRKRDGKYPSCYMALNRVNGPF